MRWMFEVYPWLTSFQLKRVDNLASLRLNSGRIAILLKSKKRTSFGSFCGVSPKHRADSLAISTSTGQRNSARPNIDETSFLGLQNPNVFQVSS